MNFLGSNFPSSKLPFLYVVFIFIQLLWKFEISNIVLQNKLFRGMIFQFCRHAECLGNCVVCYCVFSWLDFKTRML